MSRVNTRSNIQQHWDLIVRQYHNGMKICDIADNIGASHNGVFNLLTRRGIHKPGKGPRKQIKHHLNENYMGCIDCEEKAYILGLWYADGWNGNSAAHLTLQDKNILIRIKRLLCFNGKISKVKKYSSHHKQLWRLLICNKQFSKSLSNHGCTNRKTHSIRLPKLPQELMRHFIRGYFDGDGCVNVRKRGKDPSVRVSIVSNGEFIKGLQRYITNILNHTTPAYQKSDSNTWALEINNKYAEIFLDWIYQDATIFIERKRSRYERFQSY